MKRRIFAWVLLAGFLLLLVNLIFFRWQGMLSLGIYIIVATLYIFFNMGKGSGQQ
jgi:hypothetical protein